MGVEKIDNKKRAAAGISTQEVNPAKDLNPDVLADRRFSVSRSTKLSDRGMKRFIYKHCIKEC